MRKILIMLWLMSGVIALCGICLMYAQLKHLEKEKAWQECLARFANSETVECIK